MSNALVPADKGTAVKTVGTNVANDFVTMTVAEQLFGIPVLTVQDVLGPQRITRVPLAPPEVAGALNLRGRIVTACDVRRRLGLPKREGEGQGMNVERRHCARGVDWKTRWTRCSSIDERSRERSLPKLHP